MKCQRGSTLTDAHERTTIKLPVSSLFVFVVRTDIDVVRRY